MVKARPKEDKPPKKPHKPTVAMQKTEQRPPPSIKSRYSQQALKQSPPDKKDDLLQSPQDIEEQQQPALPFTQMTPLKPASVQEEDNDGDPRVNAYNNGND